MSFCINPQCPNPQNPDSVNFCQSCGSPLVLEGRYRVMREMGKGGFAKTYEVRDGGSIKVLKVLHLNEAKPVSLFQQEARVLGQLNHPGIPKGDGYFTVSARNASEPLHCLVMEYVEGQDLRQWLQSRGNQPLESDRAIAWLGELAAILHQVHQKNFFHRDIKPSNIMLKPDGHLALIDFGAARQVSRTYLQKVKGGMPVTGIISAGYTAPEQAIGKAVPQSDFFALGRTFVYLLTGKEPTAFPEHPRSGQLQWRDSATQLAPPLADFIDSLIAFLPADRPQSTGELLQRIAQLDRQPSLPPQSGTLPSSTAATVPVSPQQTSPPSQIRGNSPTYTKWIGAAIVLLLGWMGYNLYQSARSPQPVTEVPASPPGERPKPAEPPEEPRETPSPAPEEPRETPSPAPEEP
ncbi:serine/threonine-protein kinase, partial [Phormidium sp. CCY1219]|uniref:serine/threonine-protein kinase n=1 Tax=Phormidium sp. CCY1219 TaxID=2886104 RepID=UPI002D1E91AD